MNPVNPQQSNPMQIALRSQQQAQNVPSQDAQAMQGATDQFKQQLQQGAQGLDQTRATEDQQAVNSQNTFAQAAKAMAILNPNANMKDGEANTMSKVGQSIATPAYAGYCLQYVDDKTGNTNRQPTAIADYQIRAQSGQVKTTGTPPPGARVYFAPDASNGNMGHVGLANKDGTFTSATDNGVKTYSLADWQKYTGQKFIGWAK